MPAPRLYPRTALVILTGLNLLNYTDRYVLPAVQPLVQAEFHRDNFEFGLLTSAFFICYMVTAPIVGLLADRYPRKILMVGGALIWSAATLLTAVTHSFETLLFRHAIVGIGEATFVAIAPAFLADLFSETHRGTVMGVFYLTIGVGTAGGYILGGQLGPTHGWRYPFLFAAIPGFVLALALSFVPEPPRGGKDLLAETPERGTLAGLTRNGAFWSATLGMAMWTFAVGGISVWMPTFLERVHHQNLAHANFVFGIITGFNAIVATVLGGWLSDRMLRRTYKAYYLFSAIAIAISAPAAALAIYTNGNLLYPALAVAEFLLFLNNAPLNAAVVNSVGAHIRSTAIAVNLLTIHLLGDAFSPTMIGYISDRSSLRTGFLAAIAAILLSSAVLFWGMRFAPRIPTNGESAALNGEPNGVPA